MEGGGWGGELHAQRSARADHSDHWSQAATLEEELTTIARAAELFKSLRE